MSPERLAELRAMAAPWDQTDLGGALTEVLDAFEAVQRERDTLAKYGNALAEQRERTHANFLAAIEQRDAARARLAQLRAEIEAARGVT